MGRDYEDKGQKYPHLVLGPEGFLLSFQHPKLPFSPEQPSIPDLTMNREPGHCEMNGTKRAERQDCIKDVSKGKL